MAFTQIKKLALSLFLIASFTTYAFLNRTQGGVPLTPATAPSNGAPSPTPAVSEPAKPAAGGTPSTIPNPIDVIRRSFGDDDGEDEGLPVRVRTPAPTPSPSPAPTPTPAPSPAPTPAPKTGMYKDGTYTGPASYAYTGTIQVTAVVKGGKLVEVQAVDASQSGTSRQINAGALPTLKTEALQAQSAKVDAVSGATYTSAAFVESLTSALSQARA